MRKLFVFISVCIISLLFVSCPSEGDNNIDVDDFPEYTPKILWKTELDSFYYDSPLVTNGRYAYVVESNSDAGTVVTHNVHFLDVKKIDMEDGSVVWTSDRLTYKCRTAPAIKNGCVYVMGSDKVFIFSDADGALKAIVNIGSQVTGPKTEFLQINDKYIYWNYGSIVVNKDKSGIARLPLNGINFLVTPTDIQNVDAEIFWRDTSVYPNGEHILASPLLYNDVLYFLTYMYGDRSTLHAIDADNGTELWSKEWRKRSVKGEDETLVFGNLHDSLYIFDDKLMLGDASFYFFNPTNGNVLEKYEYSSKVFKNDISFCSADNVCVYQTSDGDFYSTSGGTYMSASLIGANPNAIKNVYKFDKHFNIIWSDLITTTGTMCTRPITVGGMCFVFDMDGLYVYDAETGERIGADRKLIADGYSTNAEYNGNFIGVVMGLDTKKNYLIAIEP